MHFLLSSMSVVYVLTTPIPDDGDDATMDQLRKRTKWDNDDYVCRGLILNGMSNSLFDIYQNVESSKELWDSLEAKYIAEDASSKKLLESLRMLDSNMPKDNNVISPSIVNMVEHNNSSRYNDNKSKVTCWKCGKPGHLKKDCKGRKVGNKANGSRTNGSIDGSTNSLKGQNMFNKSFQVYYVTYVSEAYYVQDDDVAWMQDMSKDGSIPAFDMDTKKYKICMLNKITKKPFQNVKRKTEVLELIHSDLCDLHATPSLGNKKYFVTFIDAASRVPNKRNKITPYELWTKRKPNLNYLRVWGCSAVVKLPVPKLETLGKRGIEYIFVGYAEYSKAFRIPNGTEVIGGSMVPKEVTEEDVAFWKEAINDDMDSIMGNNTWVLANLPPGIDYFDTYAPVARISTIRLLIDMASIHNLIIHQMDVKTAFLNIDLDEEVDLIKEFLSSKFFKKGMGEAHVNLGIRIKHGSNGIAISQPHYIEKVLKKFNYFDCTPVSTPMDTSEKLMPNNDQAVSQLEYSRVISCLMYAMICIRIDIAFVVGKLSRYTSNHEGYTDASWISNTKDNSSTSGWVFLLALATAGKKAEWLKNLLFEIPLWSKPITPISIHCDSSATLAKAYSQMYNGKSRHLGVRHSMIRDLITNRVISIEFVRSQQNLTVHLTKGLARDLVIKSAEGMGLESN
ncbi:zinc finger, CCHC-type containing protein [Tanacetum coccineum]